uniref:Glycerophosphoryl diester phosphodiesterase n=1 Tax=Kwoniella dejecticola CBS 10117 TaxID=1296121 RepID=A0A1A5ZYQ8_9TREE|nr:glycerophosphoryl diester phosphodiesterase [Kwoniella dejecticola CBS 10117]OBR82946.1 glycerophosphoryl diester phosphodiesterase [Kwoniella dejecticola CBS 10117]
MSSLNPTPTPTPAHTPTPIPHRKPGEIECWGHRGASAHLPENTLASFRAAIKEGCDGIESDVHATSDGVVLMFHDPTLDRTTDGKGLIKNQPWKGVIENVRTVKEPIQPIPLFEELIALLMEPENQHVTLNIDCKMQNDPERLFPEMARIIAKYPNNAQTLSPRIILGLWHPLFIQPAYKYLPNCTRYHIGFSIPIIKSYFWKYCRGFSVCFPILMSAEGQKFISECREKGKEVTVWTVNDENEMRTAISWGVKAVLTDRVGKFVELKQAIVEDAAQMKISGLSRLTFPWSSWRYYSVAHVTIRSLGGMYLKAHGQLYDPNPGSDPTPTLTPDLSAPTSSNTDTPSPSATSGPLTTSSSPSTSPINTPIATLGNDISQSAPSSPFPSSSASASAPLTTTPPTPPTTTTTNSTLRRLSLTISPDFLMRENPE